MMAGKIPLTIRICIYIQVFLGHMNLLRLFNIQLHWAVLTVMYNIAAMIISIYPAVAYTLGFSPQANFACDAYSFLLIAYSWAAVLEFMDMFYACAFSNALQTTTQKIIEFKAKLMPDHMPSYGFSTIQMLCFILPLVASCMLLIVIHIYRTYYSIMYVSSLTPEYLEAYVVHLFPTMSPTAAGITYYLLLFLQRVFPIVMWCNIILYISLIYYISQELHYLQR